MKRNCSITFWVSSVLCFSNVALAASKDENLKSTLVASSSNLSTTGVDEAPAPLTKEQIEYIKKELSKKDTSDLTTKFYGFVQLNSNLIDTQRSNVPDAQPKHVRLGTKVKAGIASGQVEVELLGNQAAGGTPKVDPASGVAITSPSMNNGVIIRQAQFNLDFINITDGEYTYLTRLSLGGIRLNGALFTTPDIANTPSWYSRQDGAYLIQKIGVGEKLIYEVGFGAFNNIFGELPYKKYINWDKGASLAQQSPWMGYSLNSSLGYVGSFKTTYNFDDARKFNLTMFAGSQKDAPSLMNESGQAVNTRDISHVEGSLYYNDKNIFGSKGVLTANGVTFFYEKDAASRSHVVSTNSVGMVNDAQEADIYSLSIGADSDKFLSDMIQKGDRITYAVSYDLVTNKYDDTSAQSYIPVTNPATTTPVAYQNVDFKVQQFAASIGYAVSKFELGLNAEYSKSDINLFTDSDKNAKDSEIKSYITAAYIF